jgi:acetyl/propionyl-CoA carboxylase alpha subunit
MKRTNKGENTCWFVKVTEPGERLGVDMMEINNKMRLIIAVDYFTRKIFAKQVNSKRGEKIVKFLQCVYNKMAFKSLITDNGGEFVNNDVETWTKNNNVEYRFSIAYYHKSNGRVERANRTIRNAIRKTGKPVKIALKRIIENYNNMTHRGIGMSPNSAMLKENWDTVKKYQEKYQKEFQKKHKNVKILKIGDKVLIRNEHRNTKMDNYFDKEGVIKQRVYGNVYLVEGKDGRMFKKHEAQLKEFERGEVGTIMEGN